MKKFEITVILVTADDFHPNQVDWSKVHPRVAGAKLVGFGTSEYEGPTPQTIAPKGSDDSEFGVIGG